MDDKEELSRGGRLGAMLIVAAVVLPVLTLLGMLVARHFLFVHYDTKSLTLWLVLDAVVLAAGLIVRENDGVARRQDVRAARRRGRGRRMR